MESHNSPRYAPTRNNVRMQTVGERIVMLRKARGMSTSELARAIGVKQPSMWNIESGRTKKLRGDTLAKLCEVLGASPQTILRGIGMSNEAALMEAELLALWRSMDDAQREHVIAIARAMAGQTRPFRTDSAKPDPVSKTSEMAPATSPQTLPVRP